MFSATARKLISARENENFIIVIVEVIIKYERREIIWLVFILFKNIMGRCDFVYFYLLYKLKQNSNLNYVGF